MELSELALHSRNPFLSEVFLSLGHVLRHLAYFWFIGTVGIDHMVGSQVHSCEIVLDIFLLLPPVMSDMGGGMGGASIPLSGSSAPSCTSYIISWGCATMIGTVSTICGHM